MLIISIKLETRTINISKYSSWWDTKRRISIYFIHVRYISLNLILFYILILTKIYEDEETQTQRILYLVHNLKVKFLTITQCSPIFFDEFYIVGSETACINIRHCMIYLTEVQPSYLRLSFLLICIYKIHWLFPFSTLFCSWIHLANFLNLSYYIF